MCLRISLNAKKVEGPYGGGNQFAANLENYLQSKGYQVFRKLASDLDLILIVSSKRHFQTTSYNVESIRDYIALRPNTIVVHRVNSCDEQRGRNLGVNEAMLKTNNLADYTIFISTFVRDLFKSKGMDLSKPSSVILNGADELLFNPEGRANWNPDQKLRIVTHHWSSNYMKGFDIYERLDQLLAIEPFMNMFAFTYIGNIPIGVEFKNTRVIKPTSGMELGNLLRQHHIYLTAARNEAAGMHHVEGVRCGLPVLFLNSGALPEYCNPYGIEFTLINFEEKLLEMSECYHELREKVLSCPYTASWMSAQYEEILCQLVANRRENPLPLPSLNEKLKVYFIARPFRKVKKVQELWRKAIRQLI